YINVKIPHISSLLKTDIEEVIDCSDVLVLGLRDRSFEKAINGGRHGRKVVDLVGYMPHVSTEEMQGICW
ncbi:MAG: hypothetical protein M0P19_13520, partial [Nevskia sp.]|nr:hypothetical protein [Nevskia sp.]